MEYNAVNTRKWQLYTPKGGHYWIEPYTEHQGLTGVKPFNNKGERMESKEEENKRKREAKYKARMERLERRGMKREEKRIKLEEETKFLPKGKYPRKVRKSPYAGYSRFWSLISLMIRYRDVVCFHCGTDEFLGVHHRDANKTNNEWENLITLCWPCHVKAHRALRRVSEWT